MVVETESVDAKSHPRPTSGSLASRSTTLWLKRRFHRIGRQDREGENVTNPMERSFLMFGNLTRKEGLQAQKGAAGSGQFSRGIESPQLMILAYHVMERFGV